MCVPIRFLAMKIYSDFTIPAFGRYVAMVTRPWFGPLDLRDGISYALEADKA
jgi:hypothetical protein